MDTGAQDTRLTHVDATGAARMVDVSSKDVTVRSARAAGTVRTTAEVVALLRRDALPKGDALAVARIAGIMGAKRTPDLIPLCHPIALHGVDLVIELGGSSVDITATVRTADRTGVEMEALTAVATAGLAVIDMIKAVDPAATIDRVRVLRKEGGKTGLWVRPDDPRLDDPRLDEAGRSWWPGCASSASTWTTRSWSPTATRSARRSARRSPRQST